MQQIHRSTLIWLLAAMALSVLSLAGCGRASADMPVKVEPAYLEQSEGSEFQRVVLTERAAQRLDVQTAPVREEPINGATRKVVPYGAIIYGLHGETWVYVSPEPLTFIRAPVTVDFIEGDLAILIDGPEVGTEVAYVAVAELFGIDTGVGK
ncbi:hypothetical protein FKZ61_022985 [Litorilinea aerophila]|uniref:Uncharacterized protein n=1 Tax=Litorilinea aerophila TaxID=1204385 RepID=A0A540V8T2_9CHLR|nr:hypothetical protein [Litorilinea aerophila]MCC9078963.1 hypothetical protein [Litorilinea aerophila]OUC06007.1 hypothetical protein RY27_23695 [Litorilinea aerophila]GIV80584.1 MAG: hypothetical protein KatS3mg050_4978 [Litorilinea sp.]